MDIDLFTYPQSAGWKENETSRDAALAIEASGKAPSLVEACWKLFEGGFVGTADECAALLNEDKNNIRPRISQLHQSGLIDKTGVRRKADGGRLAHVWCKS